MSGNKSTSSHPTTVQQPRSPSTPQYRAPSPKSQSPQYRAPSPKPQSPQYKASQSPQYKAPTNPQYKAVNSVSPSYRGPTITNPPYRGPQTTTTSQYKPPTNPPYKAPNPVSPSYRGPQNPANSPYRGPQNPTSPSYRGPTTSPSYRNPNPQTRLPTSPQNVRGSTINGRSPVNRPPNTVANENNVDGLMRQYGVVNGNRSLSQRDKVNYFNNEIGRYGNVYRRPYGFIPPPFLWGFGAAQIFSILSFYTLAEIATAYQVNQPWNGRDELVNIVIQQTTSNPTVSGKPIGSIWAWRHNMCTNDDTVNVLTGARHGDMDKDNPTNPTLSYGIDNDYRCYQINELINAWYIDPNDGRFHFRVPDWSGDTTEIDPITGELLGRDFPIGSIQQLRQLLVNAPISGYDFTLLFYKIDQGLRYQ